MLFVVHLILITESGSTPTAGFGIKITMIFTPPRLTNQALAQGDEPLWSQA
jgi:hypothetical protein